MTELRPSVQQRERHAPPILSYNVILSIVCCGYERNKPKHLSPVFLSLCSSRVTRRLFYSRLASPKSVPRFLAHLLKLEHKHPFSTSRLDCLSQRITTLPVVEYDVCSPLSTT